MTASVPAQRQQPIGAVHRIALLCVWVTFAASGVVFTEPAPVDLLMLGLILLLPIIGLVRFTPTLLAYLTVWVVAACAALVAVVVADDPGKAMVHTAVTFFLAGCSVVIAGFVMKRPGLHATLILQAWVVAACIAVLAALVGYFRLVPGAYELFTRFDRASGTFKDPNVFGPFLVTPILYLLHRMLTRGAGYVLWAGTWAALLAFGVLLSFSRGAWMVLAVSILLFGYLAFVTAPSNWQRLRILTAGFAAIAGGFVVLIAALQIDGFDDMLLHRASLSQSYDEGPEGRFGGQVKAKRLIIDNPLGIGAQNFAPQHHLEEPHNVYLAMFLNAGWIGGLLFILMVVATTVYGLRHALKRTQTQPIFLVVYACFVAHALEGFIIDLDHWRHFHVLIAMVWGLMLGDRLPLPAVVRDPHALFQAPQMLVPSRPARMLLAAAPRSVHIRRVPVARREPGRDDSRPARTSGRIVRRRSV